MVFYRPLFFSFLVVALQLISASHFRGGIISWRALNTTPTGLSAQILIHQRYSWRRSAFSPVCTASMVSIQGFIDTGTGTMTCYAGSCGSFTSQSADVICTDFDSTIDCSSGEVYDTLTLPLGSKFVMGFYGTNWLVLAIGGNGAWQLTGKIDLTVRPDGFLNTSPVTTTLPVLYRTVGVQHVQVIPMADADSTDTLRCRWSTDNTPANTNGYNECGSVCAPSLPTGFTLIQENCTLVYTLSSVGSYYAVALQIEDFYTSTSTTPMSSVPIQFLFYGTAAPSGCSTPPSIIGVRPNLACIGTPVRSFVNETVIAQIGCTGKTIVDFITSSPIGMTKSAIMNPSTGIYTISLTWIPSANQFGPQGFCAGAVDDTDVQSDAWCVTFLVGYTAPNLQTPLLVQGSASPIGTVFSNHSLFSIQSVNGIIMNRPSRNGTYVFFNDATLNTVVLKYDCGWSPNVTYSGSTMLINAPFAWVAGHTYYVTFDSGAASGNSFCHAESEPITSSSFWVFDIWNPAVSSTTSTTTAAPTTHTATTRGISTTTPLANLTTTGIIITTTNATQRTTTTTTTTSTLSTTTAVTITTTASVTDVSILTPKDMEEACKQPVAILTVATCVAMIPIHIIGLTMMFTQLDKMFNPNRRMAELRRSRVRR